MSTSPTQASTNWIKRQERATELANDNPWAREILTFYSHILEFQNRVYKSTQVQASTTFGEASGLREALNLDAAAESILELIAIVHKNAPSRLAGVAGGHRGWSRERYLEMLRQWLSASDPLEDGSAFFARVLLQPQAERIAQAADAPRQQVVGNQCPVCQFNPQLAVIRPEGDGGKRSLVCSFCQTEWEFRRILCPACGEVNHEKLPRYTADGIAAVRVEACDTCGTYLKSIDLTVDGHAVPVVDEIATAPLDLWAAEHGYRKIQLNVMGF